jgi:hypothetical protein
VRGAVARRPSPTLLVMTPCWRAVVKSCWWLSVYQPLRRKVAGRPDCVTRSSVALCSAASPRMVVGACRAEV